MVSYATKRMRNIRVWPPGISATPFSPYLKKKKKEKKGFRFITSKLLATQIVYVVQIAVKKNCLGLIKVSKSKKHFLISTKFQSNSSTIEIATYPKCGGITISRAPPIFMPSMPLSIPEITCPVPFLKEKGDLRFCF